MLENLSKLGIYHQKYYCDVNLLWEIAIIIKLKTCYKSEKWNFVKNLNHELFWVFSFHREQVETSYVSLKKLWY